MSNKKKRLRGRLKGLYDVYKIILYGDHRQWRCCVVRESDFNIENKKKELRTKRTKEGSPKT